MRLMPETCPKLLTEDSISSKNHMISLILNHGAEHMVPVPVWAGSASSLLSSNSSKTRGK